MLDSYDIPPTFNIASYFVDRNVENGDGDRTALITPAGSTSYGELALLTNRVGTVLRDLGVTLRGERVLLALSDGVEFVASWYAVQKIGAVTAEVYTYLQAHDYEYYLEYTRARVAIVDTVTLERMREAGLRSHYLKHLLVVGADPAELKESEHHFESLVAQASDTLEPYPTERDGLAIWKFTTGSTGTPKACMLRARAPMLSFDWYAKGVLDIQPEDRVLPVPKLFFGYARDLAALYPFGVGAAGIVFPERTTVDVIFSLIAEHRPTILVNVPTLMSAMVAHPQAHEQDLSCLRLCTSAGESLPAELHRKWDETFGVEVVEGIGSSEVYHIYISNRPGNIRRGSCGQVVPGYTARVVDQDGLELPDNEVGNLEITGATVAIGYRNEWGETDPTFDGDTVRSGDLFARDADGFYYYHGRADDLLKVSGVWVAPSEIEHCLIGHEDVVECAVIGHELEGLVRLRAYLVLREDAPTSSDELRVYVRARLSPHKCPHEILFVEALPRTTNGKLDRRALRALDCGESA